jgi:hypothetical protein
MEHRFRKWRALNKTLVLDVKQRELYRQLCEQLLVEQKEKCPWPFLDDAVAQDVLLPQITVLGKKARQQKCYATGRPILPGQTMIVVKTRPFPQFNQESKILANFFDADSFTACLEGKSMAVCA